MPLTRTAEPMCEELEAVSQSCEPVDRRPGGMFTQESRYAGTPTATSGRLVDIQVLRQRWQPVASPNRPDSSASAAGEALRHCSQPNESSLDLQVHLERPRRSQPRSRSEQTMQNDGEEQESEFRRVRVAATGAATPRRRCGRGRIIPKNAGFPRMGSDRE